MSADLYVGLMLMGALSLIVLAISLRVSRRMRRREIVLVVMVATALLVGASTIWSDSLRVTHVVPFSNAIILGQPQPILLAIIVGFGCRGVPGHLLRKCVLLVPLVLACLYQTYRPLIAARPELGDHWKGDVCRQTSQASCSPAAAATLLRATGIATNEQEMSQLCLTTNDGTPMLGLYRGLKLKCSTSGRAVNVIHCTLDQLRQRAAFPMLLSVRLDAGADIDPRYESQWGWARGVTHTVVLFGFGPGDLVDIGDPAVGREHWDLQAMRDLWHGEGIALTPRNTE